MPLVVKEFRNPTPGINHTIEYSGVTTETLDSILGMHFYFKRVYKRIYSDKTVATKMLLELHTDIVGAGVTARPTAFLSWCAMPT